MAERCGRVREGKQKRIKVVSLFKFKYGKPKDGKENLGEH